MLRDKEIIENLLVKLHGETMLSGFTSLTKHQEFKDIIKLGEDAIPTLIEKIDEHPHIAFAALSLITKENPIQFENRGIVTEMIKDWKDWFETKNKNMESPKVRFSFDNLNIVGAFKDDVYVIGLFCPDEGEYEDCVVIMSESLFQNTLTLWLIDKRDYCERFEHFCGVGGSVCSKEMTEDGETDCYIDGELKMVKVYRMLSFEHTTDMEHG